ncbi:MAG: ASKHA domain-containing protein [Nitrospinota bacterium]
MRDFPLSQPAASQDPRGPEGRLSVAGGTTILQAARAAGFPIGVDCGGFGKCTRCRVIPLDRADGPGASPAWLPPPNPAERAQLSSEELSAGWRLACQVEVRGRLAVLAPHPADRPVRKTIDTSLPLRLDPWAGPEGRPLQPAESPERALGAVVDIGTTNVCGYLVDLETGALLAEAWRPNSQRSWGADLMTRVLAASRPEAGGSGSREELTRAVRRDVDRILTDLLRSIRARRRRVAGLVFVGNSVMHHLFMGMAVESFGAAPYTPLADGGMAFCPRELGLRLHASSKAHFLPLLAGFVGADAVGVALALGLDRPERKSVSLALDLGTNVEILLGTPGGRIWCASAPAGPAFEGGGIRSGMGAGPGAVCAVDVVVGDLALRTIEDLPPAGICGTGLIEAAAGLLDLGVVDPSGRFREAVELRDTLPESLTRRLVDEKGGRGFLLAPGGGSGPVVLGQWDVRKLQAAKAAVRAGADLLLQEAGFRWEEVSEICLAGAFGAHLRPERAARIGLLPPIPLERVRVVNNAAASGARLALLSRAELARATALKRKARYVELAGRMEFQERFIEALPFPPEAENAACRAGPPVFRSGPALR